MSDTVSVGFQANQARLPSGVKVVIGVLIAISVAISLGVLLFELLFIGLANMDNPQAPSLGYAVAISAPIASLPLIVSLVAARWLWARERRGRAAAQIVLVFLGAKCLAAPALALLGAVWYVPAVGLFALAIGSIASSVYLEMPAVRTAYGLEPVGVLGRHPMASLILVIVIAVLL